MSAEDCSWQRADRSGTAMIEVVVADERTSEDHTTSPVHFVGVFLNTPVWAGVNVTLTDGVF